MRTTSTPALAGRRRDLLPEGHAGAPLRVQGGGEGASARRPGEPGLAGLVLALGAEAVATGEWEDVDCLALGTVHHSEATGGSAAALDRIQGVTVARQQPVAVLLFEIGQEGLNDLGETDHVTSLQRSTNDFSKCPWRSRA